MNRKYYARRKGVTPEPLDFEALKRVFWSMFEELDRDFYFREATGYECTDRGVIQGIWGSDPEAFFFSKLRMSGVWPIKENIGTYNEQTLFTVIEFLYDCVSEPQRKWYHKWFDCGWHTDDYDRSKAKARYRDEINAILKDYKLGYELSETGEILEKSPNGLETLVEEIVATGDPKNIDDRIHAAITKYRRYSATIDDKKDAVRTLADVLEYLKKGDIKLSTKDDSDLFNIINNFDIRHHNREQQGEYDREVWYDWMFYTFLSSINVLLKLGKNEPRD